MNARILIVEDNEFNSILLEDILRVKGYDTFHVDDGSKVPEAVASVNPDLILMDIQMPSVDGITATRLLKSHPRSSGIPVIAISSYAFKKERDLFLSAGGDRYLTKPIDVDEVLEVVGSVLQEKG